MNKFKWAKIASDYAYERHGEAFEQLIKEKFIKVEPTNLNSFLRFCITTKKETETFYKPIKRSIESFNPYFIQIENQRGTSLKIYTFNKFNSFWVLKVDLNNNTKRLLKKWEINIIK